MSKFDIGVGEGHFLAMNVSLPGKMEKFVRQKVKVGDYESASEVVREGLRLLQQREELWKAEVRAKIDEGMESIRAGRTFTLEQVKEKRETAKRQWRKSRGTK
jgi:antitoxin ParD1/3/4